MKQPRVGRRKFMKEVGLSAAAISVLPKEGFGMAVSQSARPRIRFSVIGINHNHINSQVNAVLRGGGELVSLYAAKEPTWPPPSSRRSRRSSGRVARTRSSRIRRSSSCSVPRFPIERAPIGIRVMQHGKDYMADKPGITTLEQLADVRKVQAQTRRIYSIMYSERSRTARQ
jgi:hypothetical protein